MALEKKLLSGIYKKRVGSYSVTISLIPMSSLPPVFDYGISSNRHCPWIVAAQSEALKWNKCRPPIVAVASKDPHTCANGHHASARTVCVVRVVTMADSRTERLCVLLTASSNCPWLTCTYLILPSLMSLGFPKKYTPPLNSSYPRIVAAQNKQRNKQ